MGFENCRCLPQELWHARQIPIGVTDLAMPQIVHQQEKVMVEVLLTTAPFEQDPAAEGVTQIHETRAWARAATFYACRQTAEGDFYAPRRQGRTSQRNEKGFGFGVPRLSLTVVSG